MLFSFPSVKTCGSDDRTLCLIDTSKNESITLQISNTSLC